MFDYYKVTFRLRTEMLGTCSEVSAYDTHVLEKAKKEIKKANRLSGKLTKIAEHYVGNEIEDDKHVSELQNIITVYSELIGKPNIDMPDTREELIELAEEIEAEYNVLLKAGNVENATVFMREKTENGKSVPVISSHIVLGNLKSNMRVMVNNGDKSILKSKVSVGEVFAVDVKPTEEFLYPTKDIVRKADGKRDLSERIIRFNRMGVEQTAITLSERLPKGTEFTCVLRVRSNSPIGEKELKKLFLLGKSNGFGAWRGSGGKGQYDFKMKKLKTYKEVVKGAEDGWM